MRSGGSAGYRHDGRLVAAPVLPAHLKAGSDQSQLAESGFDLATNGRLGILIRFVLLRNPVEHRHLTVQQHFRMVHRVGGLMPVTVVRQMKVLAVVANT